MDHLAVPGRHSRRALSYGTFPDSHAIAFDPPALQLVQDLLWRSSVILLVDDNDALRQGLATLLRDRGCDVLEAAGVEQARALAFGCSNLQLLITDVALSASDSGANLAATIRQHNPNISALLMSAHEDDVLLQYGVRFDETMWVLRKPFTAQEFMQRVTLLLSSATQSGALNHG